MIAHRSERPSRPEAGFSFIEILIVMGIISVLVGMVVIALKIWGEKKPEMETRDRARSVTLLLEGWKGTFDGMYPPTRLVDLAKIAGNSAVRAIKGGGNSINEGIETVFQERALAEQLPLWRNIFMGRAIAGRLGFLKVGEMRRLTAQ